MSKQASEQQIRERLRGDGWDEKASEEYLRRRRLEDERTRRKARLWGFRDENQEKK